VEAVEEVKHINRFIYAWGWLWLLVCAAIIWDILTDHDKELWRRLRYG
jgi:hypothetical protein